jgi:hypothetical protein
MSTLENKHIEIEIPNRLTNAIKNNKLILFVGAGLSKNNGFPDWNNILLSFLKEHNKDIEKSDAYINALKNEIITPLQLLEKLKNEKLLILEYFEKILNIKNLDSDLHKILLKITNKFVTTNFDKLIEHNTKINTIITHDSTFNLQKIGTIEEFIIKLHGDVSRIDNCIIFEEQYRKLYNDEQLAPFKLKSLLADYNFLFLGFSFNDPYVEELFNYISKLLDGFSPKHYIVSTNNKKIENIDTINIYDYENLKFFLEKLSKEKNTNTATPKTINKTNLIKHNDVLIEEDGSDIAPNVKNWVGREKELLLLDNDSFKVFFITGFGGEGKSALASHYLNESNKYELEDWRDFKEEEHKFQNKILSMIIKVDSNLNEKDFLGYTNEQLITIFFKKLGKKKGIFVLDNIDSYIDLENFVPTGSVGKFFKASMNYDHNSKFIFTCRPFIQFSSVDFFQLGLSGLSKVETITYFKNGNTIIKRDKIQYYAERSHKLTNGHALWLSLILAQSRKGEESLESFLEEIETGVTKIETENTSFLSKNLLANIWNSLSENEQTVLRVLAESIVSESIDDYAKIVDSEMNYKKFTKALKSLSGLSLIVEKRNTKYIELHPLVKDFIRKNYMLAERKKYISMFIKYYDNFVVILKNKISYKNTYDDFTNFTKKAELSINAGDFQKAITTLYEVNTSMISAGYIEEYLRVAKLLFNKIIWNKNKIEDFLLFSKLFTASTKNFAEFGDKEYVEKLLNNFESIIEDKSESYIQLCSVKIYIYWFYKEYYKAIDIGEKAVYLIERAEQPDTYNIKENLALAQRDTKILEKVDKALEHFLLTYKLEEIIDEKDLQKYCSGANYGNIGKCLFFKKQIRESLICYFKSFYYIYTHDEYQRLMNLGYAALWIAETLLELDEKEQAYYFIKFAKENWEKTSPVLLNQNIEIFNILETTTISKSISMLEFWRIEKYCIELIEKNINVKFIIN